MLCPINEKKERPLKYHEVKGQASKPKLAMKVTIFVEFVSAADWSLPAISSLRGCSRFFSPFWPGVLKKMHQVSRNSVLCGSQNITLVGNSVIMYGGQVFPGGKSWQMVHTVIVATRQVSLLPSSGEQHLGDN